MPQRDNQVDIRSELFVIVTLSLSKDNKLDNTD